MDIQIVEQTTEEKLQVIIRCKQADKGVLRLKAHIELFDEKLTAKKDDKQCFIYLAEVLYFEAVDNRTFLYTQNDVLEIKQRLYELEYLLEDRDFIRISKSVIVNINQIRSLKPELNRTILATMSNDECLSVSRKYVQSLRQKLAIS